MDMGDKRFYMKHKKLIISIIIFFIIIISIFVAAKILFGRYYSLLNYQSSGIGIEQDEFVEEFEIDDEDTDEENLSEEEIADIDQQLEDNLTLMAESELKDEDILNIMLIGVDSRSNGFAGRSDTMILLSINKQSKKVVMTSFLRDTYVAIEGHSNNRLNAAYAFGGADLLKDTFKRNYGITIDNCVVVNFYLVMDMVNAIGGIDLEVTDAEIRVMNGYIRELTGLLGVEYSQYAIAEGTGGNLHLNGLQALAYCRNRYVGNGDFSRTERQRKVLMLIYEKIKNMSLTELNTLAEEFLPQVATDLTQGDCLYLLMLLMNLSDYSIKNYSIPIDDSWNYARINGMAVVIVDFQKNADYWKNMVYGEE